MHATTESTSAPASLRATTRLLPVLAWAFGLAVLLTCLAGLLRGVTGLEKMLTVLMFPIQASWLLLSGWLLHTLYESLRSASGKLKWASPLALWSCFTICGTPWLGDTCYWYLETREEVFDPNNDPPLDWLVVLGGSTCQGPTRAEVAESGDRVLFAAQLYINHRVGRLITTGSDLNGNMGQRSSPAAQTCEIWSQLGIPSTSIDTLPGINTFAEMQALAEEIRTQQDTPSANATPLRIGLLTSAWHLPRAMRLSRSAGMAGLIPVAADYEMRVDPRSFWDYVPSANSFLRLERCQKEFMARLVSR